MNQKKNILVLLLMFVWFLIVLVTSCENSKYKNNLNRSQLKDVDGNKYGIVKIGSQVWMNKNLKVSRFRNNDPIPNIENNIEWENLDSEAYCYYQNNKKFGKVYGKIYNWAAVNDPRGLCPDGWHIPTDDEWQALAVFLGGNEVAGDKMKEVGSNHWMKPNEGANNQSSFTALPAGGRDEFGKFIIDSYGAHWWSITEDGDINVWVRSVYYGYGSILRDSYPKNSGFSVRCIKD